MPPRRSNGRAGGGSRASTSKFTRVSSRKTSGAYTGKGAPIRRVEAYTKAGGKAYNITGKTLYRPTQYVKTVQQNSIHAAAKRVQRINPKAKAFSYALQDNSAGFSYAGYTAKPTQRMGAHLSGRGATATKQMTASQVHFTPHGTKNAARKSETNLYFTLKDKHGIDNVRGAGHTKKFL
mmetsp:Transcript_2667/g.5273  ORF Transcript_2667/g.5273 Transcript_2667/m.5273 type:complete len:179 (+) Transcript_2667:128-664(+)